MKRKMTRARRERIKEAKKWFALQKITEEDRILQAYRKQFHVDRICAMRDLCAMKVLSAEKQAAYENELNNSVEKLAKKRERKKTKDELSGFEDWQDENFFFIAGYTSGGAPYGVTWEEMAKSEHNLSVQRDYNDTDTEELPF